MDGRTMPALAALSPEDHPCPYCSAAPVETLRAPSAPVLQPASSTSRRFRRRTHTACGEHGAPRRACRGDPVGSRAFGEAQGLRVDAPEALGIAELEFVLRYEPCRPHLTRAGRIYGAGDSVLLSMLPLSPGGASFLEGRQIQFFHRKHRFHGAFCFDGITHEFA